MNPYDNYQPRPGCECLTEEEIADKVRAEEVESLLAELDAAFDALMRALVDSEPLYSAAYDALGRMSDAIYGGSSGEPVYPFEYVLGKDQ